MDKFIIELPGNTAWLQWVKVAEDGTVCFDYKYPEDLTPYTEPDFEQIRKEAYEDGYKTAKVQRNIQAEKDMREVGERHYQKGLSDAWDVAKKISSMDSKTRDEIFGLVITSNIFDENTAFEAIEKIKAYEQEKEEQAQVGDEVECDDERYVVLQKYLNNIDELMVVLFNRRNGEINKWHLYNANGVIFKKTGRHFSEIAAVLAKMKEN